MDVEVLEKDKEFSQMVWNIFASKFLLKKQKTFIFQEYQKLLLENACNKRRRVLDHLVNSFEDFSNISGSLYAETVIKIDDFLKEKKFLKLDSVLKEKKFSANNYIDYLKIAKSKYKSYKVSAEDDLGEYLEEHFTAILDENLENDFIQYLAREYIVERFEKKVESAAINPAISIDDISKVYSAYFSLKNKRLENYLKGDNVSNHLYNRIQTKKTAGKEFFILMAIFLKEYRLLRKTSQFNTCSANLKKEQDEKVIEEVSKYIKHFMSYGEILLESEKNEIPLMKEIGKYLTLNHSLPSELNITQVLKRYNYIKEALDINSEKLIITLNHWNRWAKENITTKNIKEVLPDTSFIKDSVKLDLELVNHILETYKAKINSLEKEEFLDELKEDKYYYLEIIKLLVEEEKMKDIPFKVTSSFKEALKAIANGEIELTDDGKAMTDFFYGKTEEEELKSTFKNIRDIYLNKKEITPKLFLYFGEKLCRLAKLEEKAEEVTRRIINKVFHDKSCREFILKEKEIFIDIIQKSEEAIHDFKDKIKVAFENEEHDDELFEFAKNLGILLIEEGEGKEEEK